MSYVNYEKKGAVAVLTIDRQEALNALNTQVLCDLDEAISKVEADSEVHAVVLTGGSAYGLASAGGAQRWCEENGRGFAVPGGVVPIVPAAVEQAPSRPPEGPEPRDRQTPLLQVQVQVQVTLQRWSWPRARLLPGGSGLTVDIGPVRVSWALGGH